MSGSVQVKARIRRLQRGQGSLELASPIITLSVLGRTLGPQLALALAFNTLSLHKQTRDYTDPDCEESAFFFLKKLQFAKKNHL